MTSTEKNKIANDFGLGYTYIEFKDDSSELLSTLQIYTLPGEYKPHYSELIESISSNLNPIDLLVIPILDYTENPHTWIRSLRLWLSVTRSIFFKGSDEDLLPVYKTKYANLDDGVYSSPLGMECLILVVNTESRPDWEHWIFEYIQFVLRIICLKHGCSLLYTSLLRADPRIIQLISALLGIEVTHKVQQKLEPNLVDHTEVVVPVGFDSWGKIKTLNDDIDPLQLSKKWIIEEDNDLIVSYEKIVPNLMKPPAKIEESVNDRVIEDVSFQEFLAAQYEKQHRSQEKISKSFIKTVQDRGDDS